ncbi:hypothetical protein [Clostridium sp.]|uniref:hypothetical protein n=1 Tax=Clostridium sp. TaxID=1506 RepID=UPI0026195231
MSKVATVARENIYYKARLSASKYMDCSNRDAASELVDMDKNRITRIETNKLEAYPEEVIKMAEVYDAPYLINHYCNNICPIGKKFGCSFNLESDSDMYKASIMLMGSLSQANNAKDVLLKILEDGQITDDEIDLADKTISELTNIIKDVINLKIALEKIKR